MSDFGGGSGGGGEFSSAIDLLHNGGIHDSLSSSISSTADETSFLSDTFHNKSDLTNDGINNSHNNNNNTDSGSTSLSTTCNPNLLLEDQEHAVATESLDPKLLDPRPSDSKSLDPNVAIDDFISKEQLKNKLKMAINKNRTRIEHQHQHQRQHHHYQEKRHVEEEEEEEVPPPPPTKISRYPTKKQKLLAAETTNCHENDQLNSSNTNECSVGSTTTTKTTVMKATSKRMKSLPEKATKLMKDWFDQHLDKPYPSEEERRQMANEGNINESQVKAWFANKRNRTASLRNGAGSRKGDSRCESVVSTTDNGTASTLIDAISDELNESSNLLASYFNNSRTNKLDDYAYAQYNSLMMNNLYQQQQQQQQPKPDYRPSSSSLLTLLSKQHQQQHQESNNFSPIYSTTASTSSLLSLCNSDTKCITPPALLKAPSSAFSLYTPPSTYYTPQQPANKPPPVSYQFLAHRATNTVNNNGNSLSTTPTYSNPSSTVSADSYTYDFNYQHQQHQQQQQQQYVAYTNESSCIYDNDYYQRFYSTQQHQHQQQQYYPQSFYDTSTTWYAKSEANYYQAPLNDYYQQQSNNNKYNQHSYQLTSESDARFTDSRAKEWCSANFPRLSNTLLNHRLVDFSPLSNYSDHQHDFNNHQDFDA